MPVLLPRIPVSGRAEKGAGRVFDPDRHHATRNCRLLSREGEIAVTERIEAGREAEEGLMRKIAAWPRMLVRLDRHLLEGGN